MSMSFRSLLGALLLCLAPLPVLAQSNGTVVIAVDKPGATVYVGYRALGESPLKPVTLPAGTHRIRAALPGGRSVEATVRVEAGGTHRVELRFANLGAVQVLEAEEAVDISEPGAMLELVVDGGYLHGNPDMITPRVSLLISMTESRWFGFWVDVGLGAMVTFKESSDKSADHDPDATSSDDTYSPRPRGGHNTPTLHVAGGLRIPLWQIPAATWWGLYRDLVALDIGLGGLLAIKVADSGGVGGGIIFHARVAVLWFVVGVSGFVGQEVGKRSEFDTISVGPSGGIRFGF